MAQAKTQLVFEQMTQIEQQELLQNIKSDYRLILISYFSQDAQTERIEQFIDGVFCANIPVPQIIEVHMDLVDEFSRQLKREGRSDEILLDYRLALIDILAHLCELYRCSGLEQA